jgi:hypothetical protein
MSNRLLGIVIRHYVNPVIVPSSVQILQVVREAEHCQAVLIFNHDALPQRLGDVRQKVQEQSMIGKETLIGCVG